MRIETNSVKENIKFETEKKNMMLSIVNVS